MSIRFDIAKNFCCGDLRLYIEDEGHKPRLKNKGGWKMVLGVRIGVGKVGSGKRSIPTDNIKDGELIVWRPNPRIYRGLKGTGRTVSGIKIVWFEIAEQNGEFREFLSNPVNWFNETIAPIFSSIVSEAGISIQEITEISARLNVRASAIEVRTSQTRYILYVFSSGQIRLIKAKNESFFGLRQLLENSEIVKEYSELPISESNVEKFRISEVRGI